MRPVLTEEVPADERRFAHPRRPLYEDERARGPGVFPEKGQLILPAHERVRRSRQRAGDQRDGPGLLLEELSARVGQVVDQLLSGASPDVSPLAPKLTYLHEV